MKLAGGIIGTLKRVRWNVVLGVLIISGLLTYLLMTYVGFSIQTPFTPTYKGEGDIVMRSWLDPKDVKQMDKGIIQTEIKNNGNQNYKAELLVTAKSSSIVFADSNTQRVNKSVDIGPGESRNVPFRYNINAQYEGNYRIDIKTDFKKGKVVDELYLNVRKT